MTITFGPVRATHPPHLPPHPAGFCILAFIFCPLTVADWRSMTGYRDRLPAPGFRCPFTTPHLPRNVLRHGYHHLRFAAA